MAAEQSRLRIHVRRTFFHQLTVGTLLEFNISGRWLKMKNLLSHSMESIDSANKTVAKCPLTRSLGPRIQAPRGRQTGNYEMQVRSWRAVSEGW